MQHLDDALEELTAAHVAADGGAGHLRPLVVEQLDEPADHLRRQVVHAEVAGVLEHLHRRGLAGAGDAGDDDEILERRTIAALRLRHAAHTRESSTAAQRAQ